MSNVSNVGSSTPAYPSSNVDQTGGSKKTDSTKKSVTGKTIGNPQLSEKAADYYESLKKKYANMDFILVSADKKEQAKAQAASFANPGKMVVLIDDEKIEKMATDENFRKQYEAIISNASVNMANMGEKLGASGAKVKGYGMQVNDDGTASYFAVLEKSSAAQKARIEKHAEAKKEAKKAEAKKTAKKEAEKRLEKSRDKADKVEKEDKETVTITATSMEELLKKIGDQNQAWMSDSIQTEDEKKVGQRFDYSV